MAAWTGTVVGLLLPVPVYLATVTMLWLGPGRVDGARWRDVVLWRW